MESALKQEHISLKLPNMKGEIVVGGGGSGLDPALDYGELALIILRCIVYLPNFLKVAIICHSNYLQQTASSRDYFLVGKHHES